MKYVEWARNYREETKDVRGKKQVQKEEVRFRTQKRDAHITNHVK